MGMVYASVELINAEEIGLARRRIIDQDEVKKLHVEMLVDSGAYMLAINEDIQEVLQLPFIEKRKSILADGNLIECDVVGPVMVKFENRTAICSANVLPSSSQPLLGAIPMEEMDVLIHPNRQELIVNPEYPLGATLSKR